MTRLPSLKARQVSKALEALGFHKVRQKGSHAIFHHEDCRRTPVPIHPGKTISRYFLAEILKQLEISEPEFIKALRE